MKTHKTLAVLAAAWLASAAALAADTLPPGTLITGSVSGAASTLLGLDQGFADVPGSHITALAAADLEFLTGDFAVGVDFFSDGRVQVWNNSGATGLPGSYTLSFSLAGLPALTGITALDLGEISAGSVTTELLDDHSVRISFANLGFASEFGSFTAQLQVSAVPEPAVAGLLGAGLGLLLLRRTRRSA